MKPYKNILVFLLGVFVAFLGVFFWNKSHKKQEEVINNDYYILSNQITKMNKMLVLEQDFSSFQTHKSSAFSIGNHQFLTKEMVLYSTAKAQVTYDLKKLKIEIDSVQKILIIREIPRPEIKIYPETKIHFMEDSMMNRFDKNSLNSITESAKKNMVKSINQDDLKVKAKEQLINNLNEIFVLARFLNYTIKDETQELGSIL